MTEHVDIAGLVRTVMQAAAETTALVVAISGHAGAGKSTVARSLVNRVDDSIRIRGDDFLDPEAVHRRSADWHGVQRKRLVDEVLTPFTTAQPVYARTLDWQTGTLGEPQRMPEARVLCIDGIGLFHPMLVQHFDLRVWVAADPHDAIIRGQRRDRARGMNHDHVWSDVWFYNDREFDRVYHPVGRADVIVDNGSTLAY